MFQNRVNYSPAICSRIAGFIPACVLKLVDQTTLRASMAYRWWMEHGATATSGIVACASSPWPKQRAGNAPARQIIPFHPKIAGGDMINKPDGKLSFSDLYIAFRKSIDAELLSYESDIFDAVRDRSPGRAIEPFTDESSVVADWHLDGPVDS